MKQVNGFFKDISNEWNRIRLDQRMGFLGDETQYISTNPSDIPEDKRTTLTVEEGPTLYVNAADLSQKCDQVCDRCSEAEDFLYDSKFFMDQLAADQQFVLGTAYFEASQFWSNHVGESMHCEDVKSFYQDLRKKMSERMPVLNSLLASVSTAVHNYGVFLKNNA